MIPKIKRDFLEAKSLLHKYESWNHGFTAEVQLEKLKGIWKDAVEDLPYYHGLVARGLAPREIDSWEQFVQIPELTRQILQDRPQEFVRRSGPPSLTRMTGGSTGNPVHFGVWGCEDQLIRQLKLTLWVRAGYEVGDKLFLLWGHSHLLGTGWKRLLNHAKRRLKDAALGYLRVDAYRLDPEVCRRYAKMMLGFGPKGLIGYASALDSFVRQNLELSEEFRALGLRFVMPSAEPPPKSDTLELFRNVFKCPVVQEFGGVDFGQVASQFDQEPFVTFPDQNFVETVAADDTSESGEAVLVTALYRRYLPLIRYRQGDAISGVCKDSRGHVKSFSTLEGRVNDMITLSSGAEIHSVAIFHCIHQESEILNIQMVIEDVGTRLTLATRNAKLEPALENRIRHRLAQVAPELARIVIEAKPDIETTRAGKRRWFVDKRSAPLGSN